MYELEKLKKGYRLQVGLNFYITFLQFLIDNMTNSQEFSVVLAKIKENKDISFGISRSATSLKIIDQFTIKRLERLSKEFYDTDIPLINGYLTTRGFFEYTDEVLMLCFAEKNQDIEIEDMKTKEDPLLRNIFFKEMPEMLDFFLSEL